MAEEVVAIMVEVEVDSMETAHEKDVKESG